MSLTADTIDRLKAQLLTSNLSQRNHTLYQVINQLIDALREGLNEIETQVAAITPPPSPPSSATIINTGMPLNTNDYCCENTSIDIPGPQGPQGIQGIQGAQGFEGEIGEDGEIGPQGIPGIAGTVGATGAQGNAGPPGMDGFDCQCPEPLIVPGPRGDTGIQGLPGIQGSMGIPGFDGEDGVEGEKGPEGPQGDKGGIRYNFSTSMVDADPGVGRFRFDGIVPSQIFIDGSDVFGNAWGGFWSIIITNSNNPRNKGFLTIQSNLNRSSIVFQFRINAATIVGVGYYKIQVDLVTSGLTVFGENEPCIIGFAATGDKGLDGSVGIPGLDAEEPEYPYLIPGPQGIQGPAGGGGGSATTVETDLGSTAAWTGKFTITDAAITAASKVLVWQAPGPYTGKGTRADEAELQPVSVIATEPAVGSAVVKWQTPPMITPIVLGLSGGDNGRVNAAAGIGERNSAYDTVANRRIGRVRGNVKFSYLVFA